MKTSLNLLACCFFACFAGLAQTNNPDQVMAICPVPGQTNCVLLPDIIAGKKTLNSTNGWSEYGQNITGINKGLLRIDVSTPNVGWGPLEVFPTDNYVCGGDTLFNFFPPSTYLCPDGSFPKRLIKQRIYELNGGATQYIVRDAGWMQYHPSHGHIHIEGWGQYTLRLKDPSVADTLQWPVVSSGVKVSFCLIDLTTCSGSLGDCVDANGNVLTNASFPNYGLGGGYSCAAARQGISVGKVDIYDRGLDESFVKIPYEACNGSYFVMVQIDPDNHFTEINENNNWLAAAIPLTKQRTTGQPYAYIFSPRGHLLCPGDSLVLEASGASNYQWNTGGTTQRIVVRQPGRYWVKAVTPCGTATSDTLNIVAGGQSPVPAVVKGDTVCTDGRANLYASGNAHWYDAPSGGNLLHIGNNFQTGTISTNTTFYVADQVSALAGSVGPESPAFGGTTFSGAAKTEYLVFNAFLPFKLKTVEVEAVSAGVRYFQLRDLYGRKIAEKQVNLTAGRHQVTLDFFVPAGMNHQLGLSNVTGSVAGLIANTTTAANIGYPFTMAAVAKIVGSSLGDASYPFFYNWKIEGTPGACSIAQRAPVKAVVVPRPSPLTINGLLPAYTHAQPRVLLSGTPAGGSFSGVGVRDGYFYPQLAGVGTHQLVYEVRTANCLAQTSGFVKVIFDEGIARDGFAIRIYNTPGAMPQLQVTTVLNSALQVNLFSGSGQLISRTKYNAVSGTNLYDMDLSMLAGGVYTIQVIHEATGNQKVQKLLR